MRNFKRSFALVLALILTLALFVGCSGNEVSTNDDVDKDNTSNSDVVTIKFLHKWPQPQYMPYFEEVVKEFEAKNPNIKVNMEAVADEPIKDKLRVLMGTDSQPDIFFTWSGEFAKKFVRSNNAYDLTDVLNNDDEWKNGFMEAGLEPFKTDGKNYGVPFRINGKFFAYSTEVFDKLGLSKPTTWKEFVEICDKIKADGIVPIAFGNQRPWAGCHYLTGLNQKMVPNEIRMKDYNPKTGEFMHEGYLEALNYFKELNDKGYFNKGVNSTYHDMAHQLVASGKAAMIYVELEEFPQIEEELSGKWDFFPLPDMPNERGNKNFLTGAPDGFMISASTKHPEESIAFLKFLTSKPMADKLVKMLGWPSPIKGAVSAENNALPALIKGMEGIENAEGMALWLDTDIHIKISDVYLPGLQELLNGTKTAEEIMKEVQKKAQEIKQEL